MAEIAKAAYSSPDGLYRQKSVLGVSGTRFLNTEDLTNDGMLIAGFEGSRFAATKRYLSKHPSVTMIVGHSLGGSIALANAKATRWAVAYNPGITRPYMSLPRHSAIYRTYTDPVSALAGGVAHNSRATQSDPHGIDNFL